MKATLLLALVSLSAVAAHARPDAPRHPSGGLPNVYYGRFATSDAVAKPCECAATRPNDASLRAGLPNVFAGRSLLGRPSLQTARR